ncbi:MAG: molybdopterin molybdenumtransferase MoeA [Planctomycetes bacterium]|nr:molybdopterin molybdenumtransferase MoeA [Planctomycetota bacterium]
MIALVEAQRRIAALPLPPCRVERVALMAALGRVLARAPSSDRDLPPFDRVTMDGFAVRAAEVAVATPLRVVASVAAGALSAVVVGPGEAIRIMTGAPLPRGADAVVPIEDAVVSGASVQFQRTAKAGQNVHPRATDLRAGATPLAVGCRITPAMIPLLATLGCVEVEVGIAPRVAIVTTGNELVDIAAQPVGAQIRDSNRAGLAAQVASAAAMAVTQPIVRDDRDAIRAAIERSLAADVVLLTGGSSVGDFDFAHEVLAALGATLLFDQVRIKPGKPVLLATLGEKVLFCLPGNPVSAFVTFELLVRPLLERCAGSRSVWPVPERLPLTEAQKAPSERDLLQVARIEPLPDGRFAARPIRWSGSGDLVAIADASALVHVRQATCVAAGELADVIELRHAWDALPRAAEPLP